MRDAVQHTDLARAVVGSCNFAWRQAERAAAVPQAVLRSTGLHPRRLRHGALGVEVSAVSVIRDDGGGGRGGGGGGEGGGGGRGGLAEAMASVDAARARVTAARERVGGARATAAAVGGGIVAAVAGV